VRCWLLCVVVDVVAGKVQFCEVGAAVLDVLCNHLEDACMRSKDAQQQALSAKNYRHSQLNFGCCLEVAVAAPGCMSLRFCMPHT
jgi:hypothetical protein